MEKRLSTIRCLLFPHFNSLFFSSINPSSNPIWNWLIHCIRRSFGILALSFWISALCDDNGQKDIPNSNIWCRCCLWNITTHTEPSPWLTTTADKRLGENPKWITYLFRLKFKYQFHSSFVLRRSFVCLFGCRLSDRPSASILFSHVDSFG